MTNQTGALRRSWAVISAAMVMTGLFAFSKVEGVEASSGCCGVYFCRMVGATCANEYDCDSPEECCWSGCI